LDPRIRRVPVLGSKGTILFFSTTDGLIDMVESEHRDRSKPIIRLREPKDAKAFLNLEALCFGIAVRNESLYYWRPILDYRWAFKAVSEDGIVGGIIAIPTRVETIYINSLFVHPIHRKRGTARRLSRRILRLRARNGFILDVKTEKPDLVTFYEREGFRIAREMDNYYMDGSDRVTMVRKSPS
jgi:ribosomal protein S18 acetylase RimI-like enzyme